MSYCKQYGKDKVIFVTSEDYEKPCKYKLPAPLPDEQRYGVKLPDGSINWTCPCLGSLPIGPCGFEFRQFFSCIQTDSENLAKNEECFESFKKMKDCLVQFPKLYPETEHEHEHEAEHELEKINDNNNNKL